MKLQELPIHPILLANLEQSGLKNLTPIQEHAIPSILNKNDLIGISPTGTGKTEAFAIPILHHYLTQEYSLNEQTLILNPTRELAIQTQKRIDALTQGSPIKTISICGGQAYAKQIEGLAEYPAIIIATPGRLIDLFEQSKISFDLIKILVVDEFDQLLQLGFIKEINQILNLLPKNRQTLFFSATFPNDILRIANKVLKNPIKIEIEKDEKNDVIKEKVFYVDKANKKKLIKHLIASSPDEQILIFSRTKHAVDRIVQDLRREDIVVEALYGDKSQKTRMQILGAFQEKKIQILVATDVIARGIDIDSLPVIINYEVPDSGELYLHRIGRTGRNMITGKAYTFCDAEDNNKWIQLQLSLNKQIKIEDEHPYVLGWKQMISTSELKKLTRGKK